MAGVLTKIDENEETDEGEEEEEDDDDNFNHKKWIYIFNLLLSAIKYLKYFNKK